MSEREQRLVFWRSAAIALALHGACLAAMVLGASAVAAPGPTILAVMELAAYDPEGGEPGGGEGPGLFAATPPPAPEPGPEAAEPWAEPEPEPIDDEPPELLETVSEKAAESAPAPPPEPEPAPRRPEPQRRRQPQAAPAGAPGESAGSGGDGPPGPPGGGVGEGRGGYGGGTGRGTRDPVAAYVTRVTQRLEHGKRYPSAARNAGLQGRAVVEFTVNSAGRVLAARLAESSGHQPLDDEVLSLVRRVDPLPKFPPELDRQRLTLRVPLDFRLR
jgi:protein TonB